MNELDRLDPVFEHRVRLAIAVLLARQDAISFSRFKAELDLTDGSLGAQLRRLEDAGYIGLKRDFVRRRPVTWYHLTRAGRAALQVHLDALRAMIDGADSAQA